MEHFWYELESLIIIAGCSFSVCSNNWHVKTYRMLISVFLMVIITCFHSYHTSAHEVHYL